MRRQGKYLIECAQGLREEEWYRETCFRLFRDEGRLIF